MEFEDLDERVEWEARRVAAAFGVKEWDAFPEDGDVWLFVGVGPGSSVVGWAIERGYWVGSVISPKEVRACDRTLWHSHDPCQVAQYPEKPLEWGFDECIPEPRLNELMARGLYRLGFENEDVLSQLPPFTAHEKLELRLSMPREFWPKTWLKEEEE